MNCIEVQELLSAYIDNECTENEQKLIETHLKSCPHCLDEYNLIKNIVNMTNELEELNVPDDFHNNLMNKIHEMSPSKFYYKYSMAVALFIFVIMFSAIASIISLKIGDSSKQAPEAKNETMEISLYNQDDNSEENNMPSAKMEIRGESSNENEARETGKKALDNNTNEILENESENINEEMLKSESINDGEEMLKSESINDNEEIAISNDDVEYGKNSLKTYSFENDSEDLIADEIEEVIKIIGIVIIIIVPLVIILILIFKKH